MSWSRIAKTMPCIIKGIQLGDITESETLTSIALKILGDIIAVVKKFLVEFDILLQNTLPNFLMTFRN